MFIIFNSIFLLLNLTNYTILYSLVLTSLLTLVSHRWVFGTDTSCPNYTVSYCPLVVIEQTDLYWYLGMECRKSRSLQNSRGESWEEAQPFLPPYTSTTARPARSRLPCVGKRTEWVKKKKKKKIYRLSLFIICVPKCEIGHTNIKEQKQTGQSDTKVV